MPKILFKIIGILSGLGILFYLLVRKLTELEEEEIRNSLNDLPSTDKPLTAHPRSSVGKLKDTPVSELKKIKGIGPVIEKKLNSIGYFSLQQITQLTQAEKDRIEEELSFPGRIQRDQWVEQAKALTS